MITYAQNFEDVMLSRVFEGRRSGFYVDVGAGDPAYLSVTNWFYDLGWSGINVEPNWVLYQRLLSKRTRDVNIFAGAGAVRGEADFREFATRELPSFRSRVHKSAADFDVPSEARVVPIIPLDDILDQHAEGRHVDFLKIGVEGWSRKILNGLDLRRHRPTVIVIEAMLPEMQGILAESGYSSVYFDGLSRFYLAEEDIDLKRHFALPPNVFDEPKSARLVAAEAEVERLMGLNSSQDDEINRLRSTIAALWRRLDELADLINRGSSRSSLQPGKIRSDEAALRTVAEAILLLKSRKAMLGQILTLTRTGS